MKAVPRIVIVVVGVACLGSVAWVFTGPAAGDAVAGNSNVAGELASVLALLVAVAVLRPRIARRGRGPVVVSAGQADAALAQFDARDGRPDVDTVYTRCPSCGVASAPRWWPSASCSRSPRWPASPEPTSPCPTTPATPCTCSTSCVAARTPPHPS